MFRDVTGTVAELRNRGTRPRLSRGHYRVLTWLPKANGKQTARTSKCGTRPRSLDGFVSVGHILPAPTDQGNETANFAAATFERLVQEDCRVIGLVQVLLVDLAGAMGEYVPPVEHSMKERAVLFGGSFKNLETVPFSEPVICAKDILETQFAKSLFALWRCRQ